MNAAAPHIPVLLSEVVHALAVTPGRMIVDGTFGAGGYTRALLERGATVHAFDRDPDAIAEGAPLAAAHGGQLVLHHAPFSQMEARLDAAGVSAVDGVVLDIGVSSMQLDRAERGFSFREDGPADMRMSQDGPSAADFLNNADEQEIADVLYRYGEERQSYRVARAIVANRPIERTGALAAIVRKALGYHPGMPKDPATRTFQAIRIYVNRELEELEQALVAAERLLKPGGVLAVVTFHSLEDRIVKQFLRDRSGGGGRGSRHLPEAANDGPDSTFEKPAKPVKAGDAEIAANPRARSATLRYATRSAALAWSKVASA